MAIRPTPMLYTCQNCKATELYQPQSDVLVPPPPSSCHACGSEELQSTRLDRVSQTVETAMATIHKIFRH